MRLRLWVTVRADAMAVVGSGSNSALRASTSSSGVRRDHRGERKREYLSSSHDLSSPPRSIPQEVTIHKEKVWSDLRLQMWGHSQPSAQASLARGASVES